VPSSPIAENAVALTIAAGGFVAKYVRSQSATPGAFSEVTNTPYASKPRSRSAAIRASTGPVSAAVR